MCCYNLFSILFISHSKKIQLVIRSMRQFVAIKSDFEAFSQYSHVICGYIFEVIVSYYKSFVTAVIKNRQLLDYSECVKYCALEI